MLDAPELQDDFYLNLVDWSSQNVLSVGLGTCVYLWSACTSQVTRLCDLSCDGDSVTSVAWSERVGLLLMPFVALAYENFACPLKDTANLLDCISFVLFCLIPL